MQIVLGIVVLLLAAFGALALIGIVWAWVEQRRADDEEWDLDEDDDGGVRAAVSELMAEQDWWDMTPEALETQPAFQRGVAALADEDTPVESVVPKTRDPSGWLASMALAAFVERDDVPEEWVNWALRHPARPSIGGTSIAARPWATAPLPPPAYIGCRPHPPSVTSIARGARSFIPRY